MLNSDLTTVGPLPSLVYDTHGNTTRLADQQMSYDITDRHMSTTLDDGTTIVYVRDATGRIVSRTTDTPTEAPVTIRYTFGGAMTAVLDTTGAVIQRSITLPGGVQVSITGTDEVWSYPNLHGDVILSADALGNRSTMATATRTDASARFSYDPFGQPIHPVTGAIGTAAADEAIPDNSVGDADFGFVGQHHKLYEHQGSVATIEMGVRMYVAALGRFLSVDPIEGGVTNSYDYPSDPVNKLDLTGKMTADQYMRIFAKSPASARQAWVPLRPTNPGIFLNSASGGWTSRPGDLANDRGITGQEARAMIERWKTQNKSLLGGGDRGNPDIEWNDDGDIRIKGGEEDDVIGNIDDAFQSQAISQAPAFDGAGATAVLQGVGIGVLAAVALAYGVLTLGVTG